MRLSLRMTGIAFGLALALTHAVPVFAEFTVPANDGFVTDISGTLTSEQETALEQTLTAYKNETSNEIAVLIIPNLGGNDIVEAGVATGRAWGVGSSKNNGILIIVALEERLTRIDVGYGLEGAVPDLAAKGIIDEEMLPYFRQGEYFEGLQASIGAMQKLIGGEYTADRYTTDKSDWNFGALFFIFIVGIQILSAWLGRTKSYWLGGVVGGVFGIITLFFAWSFLVVPGFIILGLLFDYVVSRIVPQNRRGRRGGPWGGMGGGGFGGGSGGGFGGFGGGSFGGGGASGKW